MAERGTWEKAGLVGAVIGVVAAGAAAGVAIERATVGRDVRRKALLALDAAGPYGSLHGTPGSATAEDGTELYYEVEEPEEPDAAEGEGAPRLTVVFSHGYCLSQDSWHFQRAALRGAVRTVFWDQRSHGRSGRGRDQADGGAVTIDQLGRDLKAVLDAAVPTGPVVLAGHSMGGMTVLAFAEQYPRYVRERVAGVALLASSAGKLGAVTFGLPAAGARAFRAVAPGLLRVMGRQAELVERGRRATAELFTGVVKRYSFGTGGVDPGVARFAERLIEATPIDVVAEFYPAFAEHEKGDALAVLEGLPALVLGGEEDLLTPKAHSAEIAERLPGARLVLVPGAGHMVLLERPDVTDAALAGLVTAAADRAGAAVPDRLRALADTCGA